MTSAVDRSAIAESMKEAIGLRVWDPRVGVGSFVTVELGGPRENSLGDVVGQFHLWVYGSCWVIRQGDEVLGTSEDDREVMSRAVARLDGTVLAQLDLDPRTLHLDLRFDNGVGWQLIPLGEADMEEWFLFTPDGNVVTAGPRGLLSRGPADA